MVNRFKITAIKKLPILRNNVLVNRQNCETNTTKIRLNHVSGLVACHLSLLTISITSELNKLNVGTLLKVYVELLCSLLLELDECIVINKIRVSQSEYRTVDFSFLI